MAMTKTLLRPGDLAEAWGVGRSTIYRLIAEGRIPTVQLGGRLRIPAEAAERLVREAAERGGQVLPDAAAAD